MASPLFLGPAAPNKSSILLVELNGLLAPAGGALAALVLDIVRCSAEGIPGDKSPALGGPLPPGVGGPTALGGPEATLFSEAEGMSADGLGGPAGGALARPGVLGALPPMPMGGAGLEAVERGMPPLGGGGAAFLAAWSSGLAFLLTHRFCSGS